LAALYIFAAKTDVELPKVEDDVAKLRVHPKASGAIGRIIKCLRNGPRTNLELKLLGIPPRSVDRYLMQYLKPWGLVDKDEYGRWVWFQQLPKTFSSQEESRRALAHTKLLLPAFESLVKNPLMALGDETAYAEQHIKTGYPEVYEILENYREAFIKAREVENELLRDYPTFKIYRNLLSFVTPDPEAPFLTDIFKDLPKATKLKCVEIYEKKLEAERNFSNETQKIISKVKHGTSLCGDCDLCPPARTGGSLET